MQTKPDTIHTAVQDHYAERARQGGACCSPEPQFYSIDEVEGMPEDVANFSLGCGNAVEAARLQTGETVVDLGSGGGLECFIAAKQVGDQGRVIGVDMTPDMLARARQAAERMGFDKVEFRRGLIEDLPIADETADVVISNCVINLSPDKNAVLAEVWRVLKPGGRIAVSDIVTRGEIPAEQRSDMALWSACASGALSVEKWTAGLAALGFEAVRIEPNEEKPTWLDAIPEGVPFSAAIFARKPV
jgi:SAM-dependent methyltransferase